VTISEICTAALLKNGQHETLAADFLANPTTKSAELCALFYPQARKTVLRMQAWTCAKKRVKLEYDDTLDNETTYQFTMPIPDDYIRMVMVLDEDGQRTDANYESGVVYTDTAIPTLVYIYDNQDTSTWDPLLTDAIILQLASSIAYPLTGSHENEVAFGQASGAMVRAAFTQSKREQRQGPKPRDEWTEGLFPVRKQ